MQEGPSGPLSPSGVSCSPAGDSRDPFPPLEGSKGPVSAPGPVAVSERSVWDVPTGSPVSLTSLALPSLVSHQRSTAGPQGVSACRVLPPRRMKRRGAPSCFVQSLEANPSSSIICIFSRNVYLTALPKALEGRCPCNSIIHQSPDLSRCSSHDFCHSFEDLRAKW